MITEYRMLENLAKESDGHLTTKQIETAGIPRSHLKQYVDAGQLIRIQQGYYTLPNGLMDEYAFLQSQCKHAVFSFGTALYLWGMSDRVPHILDLTVPQGTNVSRIKKRNSDVRFHYDKKEIHLLGMTETKSPQGNTVILYDRERCLCDLIHRKKEIDTQLYTQAVKEYFFETPNPRKLLKYAKQMGLEDRIRFYMEVLL